LSTKNHQVSSESAEKILTEGEKKQKDFKKYEMVDPHSMTESKFS